jgi:type IV pilus assembly protein PilF
MKAFRYAMALACIAAAGCATQPDSESALRPADITTGQEGADRMRARIHTELAAGYFELGNMSVALEELKIATLADPNYAPAHGVGGLVYAALKEDRLAEESFQRALRLSPLDHDVNNNYGMFLCDRKREQEAIGYFLAAVRNPLYQNPDRSLVNAGVCARRRGDTGAAQGYFQQALKVQPNQTQALFQLADLAFAGGDFAGARDYLNRLKQMVAPTPELLWLGVRIERRLGDRNTEASYAQQLRNHFPASKEAKALAAGKIE